MQAIHHPVTRKILLESENIGTFLVCKKFFKLYDQALKMQWNRFLKEEKKTEFTVLSDIEGKILPLEKKAEELGSARSQKGLADLHFLACSLKDPLANPPQNLPIEREIEFKVVKVDMAKGETKGEAIWENYEGSRTYDPKNQETINITPHF